ncbi:cell wall metabolism sensor histidine kinase WalK [Thiomicrospira sp. ALE5]|uniref:cell wall metabolism sensor histidine kinase WalK n=1 Tax=Thiomicrospira sp. ALE5 TaxID=748650 RepID=UPI0008E1CB8B|nr:cell wall metabolism sensor histidine kinase WalK [Thiomicrospira sp. ALE5]SFR60387.1 hypothetical protein SAMN03092900_1612 [Thiomicrospira sp. ALE5]
MNLSIASRLIGFFTLISLLVLLRGLLAISRAIVHAYHGTIRATSQDNHTCFKISLNKL